MELYDIFRRIIRRLGYRKKVGKEMDIKKILMV